MSKVLHRNVRRLLPRAIDCHGLSIRLEDGREIIDACGGAAVSCLGHNVDRIAEAIHRQCLELPYVHSSFFTNSPAEALAELLVDGEQHFARALFVSSGSEAMEFGLKIARQYFVETGHPERTQYIARRLSYHGATFATLAAGGHAYRRAIFEPMLQGPWHHVSPCFPYRYQAPGEATEAYVRRLVSELEAEFQRIGPERVIAVCVEPVVGATTGCVAAVDGYLRGVRDVCDRHGALLIYDEVMCGMGRTGYQHAWEFDAVAPDVQAIAKGLGGGFQPIGGVLIGRRVLDGIGVGTGAVRMGHTYQNHPVACAAALEVQRIIREEDLLRNVGAMGEYLGIQLQRHFGAHPFVGEVRGRGLFWALELVADRSTRATFPTAMRAGDRVQTEALARGLAVYPGSGTADGQRGDHVLLAPPFNVERRDIDNIVERLADAFSSLQTTFEAAAISAEISTLGVMPAAAPGAALPPGAGRLPC